MKKILFIYLFVCLFGLLHAQTMSQLSAFPGAEGFGRYAQGVRGAARADVYHVTTLDDAGPGSLRDAVSRPGRVVVFDVSGVIRLKSRLAFSANSYIAGHTAPGSGVIVYGNGVSFAGADNIIVRYMRIYTGIGGDKGIDAGTVGRGHDMVFDHCSFLWGQDESFSISQNNPTVAEADKLKNITVQHSIIGQGLLGHSCGGLIQTAGGTSIIGCLYIDNTTRNPKVKGLNQFINNVVYNWGGSNGYILADSNAPSWSWMEGNYFIAGPGSGTLPFTRARPNFQLYAQNNTVDNNKNGVLDGIAVIDTDYANSNSAGPPTMVKSVTDFVASNCSTCADIPKPFIPVSSVLSPGDALARIIVSVGASLPVRSEPDAYVIAELTSYGTKGKFIRDESENGIIDNIGVLKSGKKLTDSDNDGIPDSWETANGLNKNRPEDAVSISANGYLNIENYINSIEIQ
jgi:hypothetical protein